MKTLISTLKIFWLSLISQLKSIKWEHLNLVKKRIKNLWMLSRKNSRCLPPFQKRSTHIQWPPLKKLDGKTICYLTSISQNIVSIDKCMMRPSMLTTTWPWLIKVHSFLENLQLKTLKNENINTRYNITF